MDVLQAIRRRRSINFFDPDRKVPEANLRELIETANLSCSSFNLQPWKLVVVQEPERKSVLRRCAFDQPKVEEASAVFIVIGDPFGLEENIDRMLDSWIGLGYIKPEMRQTYDGMARNLYGPAGSLQRKFFAVKNAALFAMNIMLAAQGLGLETHPMDGFDESCVKKEFGIPEDKIIPMLIAVGYLRPGVTLPPRSFRRQIEEFVRHERY